MVSRALGFDPWDINKAMEDKGDVWVVELVN